MRKRRQGAEHARVAEQRIEPTPTLEDCRAQSVNRGEILQIERHKRSRSSALLDFVVSLFQPANGARDQNDMSVFRRQRFGGSPGRSRGRRR